MTTQEKLQFIKEFKKEHKKHWQELEEKFFAECVTDVGGKEGIMKRACMEPEEIFEWFKANMI